MHRICRSRLLAGLMMIIGIILPYIVLAQDPGGGPDAPIDGGVSVLLAAGIGYGVKRYRDRNKHEKN